MAWLRHFALGLALLLVSHAALAQAQRRGRVRLPPCNESSSEARDQYICGLHAVESLQYLEAVRLFAAAYVSAHEPAALFNQGLALKSMGRFVEARQIFARLLEAHADASAEVRSQAETHLRQAEESMARVRVDVHDAQGAALMPSAFSVELNGRRATPNGDGLFELDPGEAVFLVSASGYESARWEGNLHRGLRTLPFELVANAAQVRTVEPVDVGVQDPPPREPETEGNSTLTWVLVAGGVAVLAAGAVVAYVLVSDREQQLQLRPAPEFRSTDVLRF